MLKNFAYVNLCFTCHNCLIDDEEEDGFIEKDPITVDDECYEYELIGVTVHTGTADGGHYYSFIRDKMSKSESGQDKW